MARREARAPRIVQGHLARKAAALIAVEAGVCAKLDTLAPIVVESQEYGLLMLSQTLADNFTTVDGTIVVPFERTKVIKARSR
jgi:hypothetical protein